MGTIRYLSGIICMVLVTTFTACSAQNPGDRQVIEKTGKTITVLDKSTEPVYSDVTLDKIDTFEGVRGTDWLDDNTIMIYKENKTQKQMVVEGQKMYPRNLYLVDLKTKEEKIIDSKPYNQTFARFSPNKRNIFYKQNIEEDFTGYILNMESKVNIRITEISDIVFYDGSWVDNDIVVFPDMKGNIQLVNVNGRVEATYKTSQAGKNSVINTYKLDNRIYYTTHYGQMYVMNIDTMETKNVKDKVVWLVPSPDSKIFAMVKQTGQTKRALVLTDLEGNEKSSVIAEGTQIFNASWSPDQTKLAYTVISDTGTSRGLFVSDIKTQKVTQLLTDIDFSPDALTWSPSGKKILVSAVITSKGQGLPEIKTYVVTLK